MRYNNITKNFVDIKILKNDNKSFVFSTIYRNSCSTLLFSGFDLIVFLFSHYVHWREAPEFVNVIYVFGVSYCPSERGLVPPGIGVQLNAKPYFSLGPIFGSNYRRGTVLPGPGGDNTVAVTRPLRFSVRVPRVPC